MLSKILKGWFKDYYWDFYMWSQSVPIDTHIDDVIKLIPNYATVDWGNPKKLGEGLLYPVVKIRGHHKKKSTCFLGFVDGLYTGCVIW